MSRQPRIRQRRNQAFSASRRRMMGMRRDAIGEEEPVPAEPSASQPRVQAVCAAVGACGWRSLTAEMVIRRLLGAVDRLLVLELTGATPEAAARDLSTV